MFQLIAGVLAWFYQLTLDYAAAIALLTVTVMVVLTPLTLKGTRSMIAMQRFQPEMRAIQQRYKGDRQKANEAMMALYKEHSINPLGGCLPLLAQMPVFLVLFQVLRGLTSRAGGFGTDTGRIGAELAAGMEPLPGSEVIETFDPKYLDHTTKMYEDLSGATEMRSLGMDLSQSAQDVLRSSFVSATPYLLLIAVVALTGWYQQRQIQGRQTATAVNPQQQMIMKFLPIMLPVISFTLPSGLVVYFLVSNVWRVGQQWFITKTMYKDGKPVQSTKKRGPGLLARLVPALDSGAAETGPNGTTGSSKTKETAPGDTASKSSRGSGSKAKSARGSGKASTGRSKSKKTHGRRRKSDTDSSSPSGGSRSSRGRAAHGRVTPPGSSPRPRKRKKRN